MQRLGYVHTVSALDFYRLFSLILKEAPLKCTDVHVFVDGSYKFLGISKDSSSESVAEKSKFVQIKSEGSDDSQQMSKLMFSVHL